jgi:hypothetical protein
MVWGPSIAAIGRAGQVDQHDLTGLAQPGQDGVPRSRAAAETVDHEQRSARAAAFFVEDHAGSNPSR